MRPVARLARLLSLLCVAACSSSPANGGGGGAGDDGGSSGGDGSGGGHGDGGADDAAGGGDGSDAGSTGDSSGQSSAKLYPLAVGNTWTYDVQPVGAGSVCASGTHTQQVTGTRTIRGLQAFDLTSFCVAAGTSEVAPVGAGDEVDLDYQGSWLVMIDPALAEGHSWTYFNSGYTWHRESSVAVPAGTFTDCWTARQNVSYTAYLTYCRGAGLVHSYSQDLSGAGWDAKLVSKTF